MAHTLGNPFDLEGVMQLADKHNLFVVEDTCDAIGAKFNGKAVGSFGDLSTASFYPAHHITMGEGGCVMVKKASSGCPGLTPVIANFSSLSPTVFILFPLKFV